jgi:hypothetical protein
MNTYYIGIYKVWNDGAEDRRDFEVSATSKKEARVKAVVIARDHGNNWKTSYVEEA